MGKSGSKSRTANENAGCKKSEIHFDRYDEPNEIRTDRGPHTNSNGGSPIPQASSRTGPGFYESPETAGSSDFRNIPGVARGAVGDIQGCTDCGPAGACKGLF